MSIKALLVGVSDYSETEYESLPLCKNDLNAMQTALINGLKVDISNIERIGLENTVTKDMIMNSFFNMNYVISEEDTFIFYFSGHGGNEIVAVSNCNMKLKEIFDEINNINAKNKIIILDCCHAGSFKLEDSPPLNFETSIDTFVGHGCAVLASCGANETSGFNNNENISLYTSFLCYSLTNKYLIRNGKKSLETINKSIYRLAEEYNRHNNLNIQTPIFRSNITGDILFDVEEYIPYKVKEIYEETEEYIIYSVEPLHISLTKRLAIKVILRYKCSLEQIAEIATEIKNKALYYSVFQNKIAESKLKNKLTNIVWCYFAYDEEDVIDGNYICHTTWVDDAQDKKHWYSGKELINNVYFYINSSYDMIKSFRDKDLDKSKLIDITRKYTTELINLANKYIALFREFNNRVLSEHQFINLVKPLNTKIEELYLAQSNLPIPPKELDSWCRANENLAVTIHNISLFYNINNLDKWEPEKRKWLLQHYLETYQKELETFKDIDKSIEF